jgi:hypothetical protein
MEGEILYEMYIQPDGMIVASGWMNNGTENSFVLRFDPNLSVDLPENSTEAIKARVFPNPVTQETKLQLNLHSAIGDLHIGVYDIQGRLMHVVADLDLMNSGRHEFPLNRVSAFDSGVYLVKVFSPNSVVTLKLIVE